MKKNKHIFSSVIFAFGLIALSTAIASAQPTSTSVVGYPISELGGCKNQTDCKDFCGKGENMTICVNFAEKKGMLSGEELRVSRLVAEKVAKKQTPGGCSTKEACESFCQGKVENINECISFGEDIGVIPKSELAEAKKIAMALSKGSKMPGACKTKNECENFCSVASHIDECLNFAEAAGILNPKDLEEARKVAPFLKKGETPGKCQTKESCDSYCGEDSHFEECIGFAEKAGFISNEDASMAKKVGGKGPGGCKGKDECMSYCDLEQHSVECSNFAKEKGLLTKEQEENINTGVDRMKAGLEQIPPEARAEIISCLEKSIGKEKFDRIMAKQDMPTQSIGGKIEACFGKIEEVMKSKIIKEGISGGTAGGAAPSKEEIMKNIPEGVPSGVREQIEKQIESQIPPQSPGVPSSETGKTSVGAPNVDCSIFAQVPSCNYVQGTGHDFCLKCKGQ